MCQLYVFRQHLVSYYSSSSGLEKQALMKRIISLLPRSLIPKILELKHYISYDYYCVAIRYPADCACEAIQKFETKLYLSTKPPVFLETKRRFLWSEAPLLPLPNCTSEHCRCRYAHYQDRRGRDRRHRYDDPRTAFDPGFVGRDRREGPDRRSSAVKDQPGA